LFSLAFYFSKHIDDEIAQRFHQEFWFLWATFTGSAFHPHHTGLVLSNLFAKRELGFGPPFGPLAFGQDPLSDRMLLFQYPERKKLQSH